MAGLLTTDDVKRGINKAIEIALAKAVDEAVEAAKKQVEERMREALAGIVINTANFFDYNQDKQQITITIKNGLELSKK